MNAESNHQIEVIDIERIIERPGLRNAADDLSSLQKSIRDLGLLFPLLVNANQVLIAGYRRLEACRRLGWTSVPVLRVDVDENSLRALDILVQENLCRRDLNPEELEHLIERKKELLGRLRWRSPWKRLADRFRHWRRSSPSADGSATTPETVS